MRPLTLKLDYFGPFRHQTVDFTKFNDFPVFLISGKTGAGKTTIFDAMCFALFGGTSGGDRQVKQMRSDFATADEVTTVTFTFEHQNRTYRIVRSPEQEVAKKRGTGNHVQAAAVTLTVFDEQGKEVEEYTKVNAVQNYVRDLLQLTREQFSQIVLLPQGQFRQFLMANSDDKEKVLRDIFGTSLYSRWAQQLKAQLKRVQAANNQVSQQLQTLQGQLTWTTQTAAAATSLAPQAAVDAQQVEQQAQTTALAALKREFDTAKTALTHAQAAQTAGQTLQQNYQSKATLTKQLADLTAQKAMIDEQRQRVQTLEWVQKNAPAYQALQTTRQRVQAETARQAELTERLAALQATRETATAQAAKLTAQAPQAEERQAQITTLTAKRPVYEQLANTRQAHQQAVQRVTEQQSTVTEIEQRLSALATERQRLDPISADLTPALTKQRQLDQRSHALRELTQSAAQVAQQAEKVQTLTATVAQQRAVVATKRKAAQAKEATYRQLDGEWASEQIAILSQRLQPGQPCPVCGATDHPQPAATTTITVTEAAVKAAQQAATAATRELAAAENQLTADQSQLEAAQTEHERSTATLTAAVDAQLGPTELSTTVSQRLAEAQDQLTTATRAVRQRITTAQSAQDRLAAIQTTVTTLTADQTTATAKLTTLKNQALELATQLADQEQQRSAAYPDLPALDAHIQALKRDQEAYQHAATTATQQLATVKEQLSATTAQLATTRDHLTTAQATVTEQTTQLTTAMLTVWETADFERLAQLMDQLGDLAELRTRIKTYDQQTATLNGQLLTVTKTIGQQPQPDLAQLAAQVAAASETEQAVEQRYYELDRQLKGNQAIVAKMQATLATVRDQQEQLAELAQLANVANGSGPQKLSLERFVLQTYLQRVLKTGNQRLQQLTRGRYQFQLDHTQGTFRNGTGLEINVYDDNAGKVRSVHTLSGGESFVAALSLALALATVIQEQAGGIKIDALFIDEGFGSLDEDALDMAMETLQQVEGKSRMIGIISHVSELEHQLPAQLKVLPQGNGESVVKYQLGFA
ncbi:SMC family ATPase [Lactiplantibacillus garii]|uniref:Nuclease SbcCD subunit C n=1 Tax=Lactiplantibacillus garii TaxID=2306423 RepID=A0A426D6R0_9LACO|nr:SMC family ATPase [Lactiplantibacillus garii]RRK10260.1 SMC family ATPase [Lactiplantibacillus garii]